MYYYYPGSSFDLFSIFPPVHDDYSTTQYLTLQFVLYTFFMHNSISMQMEGCRLTAASLVVGPGN